MENYDTWKLDDPFDSDSDAVDCFHCEAKTTTDESYNIGDNDYLCTDCYHVRVEWLNEELEDKE